MNKEEAALLDFNKVFSILLKWKWLLIIAPLLSFAIAFFVSRMLPKTYKASGKIYPIVENQRPMTGLLATLGTGIFNVQSQTNYLKALLYSDTMINKAIDGLGLNTNKDFLPSGLKPNDKYRREKLVLNFQKKYKLLEDTEGAISISFKSKNPELAVRIVDKMIELLGETLKEQSQSKALDIEKQVKDEEESIRKTEQELRDFQKKYGLVSFTEGTTGLMQLYLDLEKQKTIDEFELRGIVSSIDGTGSLEQEVRDQRQKIILQSRISEAKKTLGTIEEQINKLPDKVIQLLRLKRDIATHEAIYKVLIQEYEMERFQSQKREIKFTILDRASVTPKPVSPRVIVNSALAFCACFVICFAVVLFKEFKEAV